jgi:hypothetical protein
VVYKNQPGLVAFADDANHALWQAQILKTRTGQLIQA